MKFRSAYVNYSFRKSALLRLLLFFFIECSFVFSAPCVPVYEDIEIELLWMFNPDSTGEYYKFTETLRASHMPILLDKIKSKAPESRAGIAVWGGQRDSYCYRLHSAIINDFQTVKKEMSEIRLNFGGSSPEQALLGIARAVTDNQMGWTSGRMSSDGKRRMIRILIMSTDDKSTKPSFNQTINECHNQLSASTTGKILAEKKIYFTGLVTKAFPTSDFLYEWEDYMEQMIKEGAQGIIKRLDLDNFENVIDDVITSIESAICETTKDSTEAYKEPKDPPVVWIAVGAVGGLGVLAAMGSLVHYQMSRSAAPVINCVFEGNEKNVDDNFRDQAAPLDELNYT